MKSLLITGGTGYIGSQTVLEFLNEGYKITVIDNLSNSNEKAVEKIKKLAKEGADFNFIKCDIKNIEEIEAVFAQGQYDGIIHFAGLKAVGESVEQPLMYYDNNIAGTINLLKVMAAHQVYRLVFSSSATVYSDTASVPFSETSPLEASSPYGRTKQYIEQILKDLTISDPKWRIINLRYFNPFGAHKSGELGENPNGIPNNLVPYITQVAVGRLPYLNIFGDDYNTPDGTCIRDFVHVQDLATGHRKAIEYIFNQEGSVYEEINLGSGKGYSVLEILHSLESVINQEIPYKVVDRRPGDIATSIADISKAKALLNWEPQYGIQEMCEDTWRWQKNYPNGF